MLIRIRLVLACAAGTKPQLLENWSYIATYSKENPDYGWLHRIELPAEMNTSVDVRVSGKLGGQ